MKVKKEGMTLRRLITGPIFLLLFLIVTPLTWLLMHAFVYLLKYPYWRSGETHRANILIAYADSVEDIKRLWPEAYQIEWDEVDEIVFTSRFPRPDWYKD